ncbi:MAG: hypothetical protein J0L92_20055 [Deltaproteobacteria bacterium]|nr:hypothetical protein [Deltaproteobacteria bacterium]
MRSPRPCSLLAGIISLLGGNACTPSTVPDDATFRETDASVVADATMPDAPADHDCGAPSDHPRLVVTADWLARSLTLLDLDRVIDPGCDATDAILGTIDLSRYPPGPLEIEMAPDGRTAMVSVGPGFFEGAGAGLVGRPEVPPGGSLLIVDVIDRSVRAEIATTHVPMGIAIAPDGSVAYVAEYGTNADPGTEIAIVDLRTDTLIDELAVGPRPEQIVLSADGSLGAVTVDDGTRVFRTDDVRGSLAPTLATGRDPSGVVFVPGTHRLVVTNSMATSISIVDVSDPSHPIVVSSPTARGVPYPATWIPGTTEVLVASSFREGLFRFDVTTPDAPPTYLALSHGAFVLEAEVTSDGAHAIVAHPIERALVSVDLATGEEHALSWLDATGPTYVALQPAR